MTSNRSSDSLRDALYALAMGDEVPDAALLDDLIRQHPEHREYLTDFAVELALDALAGNTGADAGDSAIDLDHTSQAVREAKRRFNDRRKALAQQASATIKAAAFAEQAANPFTSLSRSQFRDLAERLHVNPVLLAKLRDRQIVPETIPVGFRTRIAEEMRVPVELVAAHLAANQTVGARQFHKADAKPRETDRQTFADAVKGSGLTEEQQRYLLEL